MFKSTSILIIILFLFFNSSFALTDSSDQLVNFNQEKIASIEIIKQNLILAKQKLSDAETILDKEKNPKQRIILETDVKRFRDRYNKLKLQLISVVTNIKMDEIQSNDIHKKRDYLQEAQELLGPAFDTIQRISEKPRKIESLRKELNVYEQKLAVTSVALKNIEIIKNSKEFQTLLPDMEEFLSDSIYNINDLAQEFSIKRDRINRELKELTKDDQTLVGAMSELSREFFSNKGKHLGIAFLLFAFTIWSLTVLKNIVILKTIQKSNVEWIIKPISALYGVLTFIFALSIFILSLYFMGDWVLVTLIVLMLSAILWGSKAYIHKYLAEGRLILNLGTIKEGELVIFRGIPWKVKNINFVTIFENDFLDSSTIRIEIAQIFHIHSRKILPNEQWFPTRSNDWVMLSDGTYGQIKLQTVEQIIVELKSLERKYYTTVDYLNLRPINLSHGFTQSLTWGIDYNNQHNLIDEIIPQIKTKLSEKMKNTPYTFQSLIVEFQNAGTSSLNLLIEMKFRGSFASSKLEIERTMNSTMLEISNELKINIPFNRLTVDLNQK
jgi:hypothetical protein